MTSSWLHERHFNSPWVIVNNGNCDQLLRLLVAAGDLHFMFADPGSRVFNMINQILPLDFILIVLEPILQIRVVLILSYILLCLSIKPNTQLLLTRTIKKSNRNSLERKSIAICLLYITDLEITFLCLEPKLSNSQPN